jgi:hypothetical protein
MSYPNGSQNPLRNYFRSVLHDVYGSKIRIQDSGVIEEYVADLLVRFLHQENIFSLRDAEGNRVESLTAMLEEADIRLKATSFDREREVHRHIGDFLLFWSGLFPEMLTQIRGFQTNDPDSEAALQGQFSYEIVSSFDHAPYGEEAPLFRRLATSFLDCREGLRLVRASFEGFRLQGWNDGFQA